MRYRVLLFDADDTLLDFQAAERDALARLFEAHGAPLTEEMRAQYSRYNRSLWKRLESGEITREELLKTRFSGFFAAQGMTLDGPACEEEYRGYLALGSRLLPGAKEVCTLLSSTHTLCIVTNGISGTQKKRLCAAGIGGLFDRVFISEELGFSKPSPGFFDGVFRALPGISRRETLIIGDSLTSDVLGGVRSGIDTCWFNPSGQPAGAGPKPTYEIASLWQLLPIARMEDS